MNPLPGNQQYSLGQQHQQQQLELNNNWAPEEEAPP